MIKIYLKNHWKAIFLILIIILGFVFYYEVIPRYSLKVAQKGYEKCLNDLSTLKAVPLNLSQQEGNKTINKIFPVGVCSDLFIQQYENICGDQG